MGRSGKLSLDEVLERLNALMVNPDIKFEETEEQKKYLDEKKKVYYIQFTNDHRILHTSTCVRLEFKEDTMRRTFDEVLEEAKGLDNQYKDLLDVEFQAKHGIESIEVLEADKHITLPTVIKYYQRNPETGEDEEVDRNGNPI